MLPPSDQCCQSSTSNTFLHVSPMHSTMRCLSRSTEAAWVARRQKTDYNHESKPTVPISRPRESRSRSKSPSTRVPHPLPSSMLCATAKLTSKTRHPSITVCATSKSLRPSLHEPSGNGTARSVSGSGIQKYARNSHYPHLTLPWYKAVGSATASKLPKQDVALFHGTSDDLEGWMLSTTSSVQLKIVPQLMQLLSNNWLFLGSPHGPGPSITEHLPWPPTKLDRTTPPSSTTSSMRPKMTRTPPTRRQPSYLACISHTLWWQACTCLQTSKNACERLKELTWCGVNSKLNTESLPGSFAWMPTFLGAGLLTMSLGTDFIGLVNFNPHRDTSGFSSLPKSLTSSPRTPLTRMTPTLILTELSGSSFVQVLHIGPANFLSQENNNTSSTTAWPPIPMIVLHCQFTPLMRPQTTDSSTPSAVHPESCPAKHRCPGDLQKDGSPVEDTKLFLPIDKSNEPFLNLSA